MSTTFWQGGAGRTRRHAEFAPEDYADIVSRVGAATAARLEVRSEEDRSAADRCYYSIRLGGRRVGWGVACAQGGESARRASELAAEVVSRLFTSDQDIASLALEVTDRYEELNFLYSMGERVGALLDEDEICAFVVEEAAWLMNCDRASIMVPDPETGELTVRAAVGLDDAIAGTVSVKPGEGISGKVFESGHGVIINGGDPMPAESLGVSGLRESKCFLSVPLKITSDTGEKDQVVGVFNLTRKREGDMFTASDLKLVSSVAATTATQIHNCRLINAERERQRLEHELEMAARIQLSLLPEGPLHTGRFEVGGHCKLAQRVGGDLFDYWLVDDALCLLVADVSGHDMGAALMATALRSVMRSETVHRQSVAGLIAVVNRALFYDLCKAELFISIFYGEVHLPTGRMTFCRAGHPMPLMVRGADETWLDTEGMLLGIEEDCAFEECSVELEEGDVIVFYTDGLMDAGCDVGAAFGTEGISAATRRLFDLPPGDLALGVVEAAREHSGTRPLEDDATAMVLRTLRRQ